MKEISQIQFDCIMQHFKALYEQDRYGEEANFAEPCARCQHISKCHCNWMVQIEPFASYSNVQYSVAIPTPKGAEKIFLDLIYEDVERAYKVLKRWSTSKEELKQKLELLVSGVQSKELKIFLRSEFEKLLKEEA